MTKSLKKTIRKKPQRRAEPLDFASEYKTSLARMKDASAPLTASRVLFVGKATEVVDGTSLVTVMPDGLRVGWSTCARCHDHVLLCACPSIRPPRDIEYIWDATTARLAGEEWSVSHRNYRGSFGKRDRTSAPSVTPKAPTKSLSALTKSTTKKSLRRTKVRVEDITDRAAMDKRAKTLEAKGTKSIYKLLGGKG
jgi:hypothetical protein